MSDILVITDQPQRDLEVGQFAVQLAHRLNASGLAIAVSSRPSILRTGVTLGIPDGGILHNDLFPWSQLVRQGDQSTQVLFDRCREQADALGLTCETGSSQNSLQLMTRSVGRAYNLVIVGRRPSDPDGVSLPDAIHLTDISAPLLICPPVPSQFSRIVVAVNSSADSNLRSAWAQHWSRLLDIPLLEIQVPTQPESSWNSLKRIFLKNSRRRFLTVRNGLQTLGLGSDDLMIVDRNPGIWQLSGVAFELSLEDLMMTTSCTLGVIPNAAVTAINVPGNAHNSPAQ